MKNIAFTRKNILLRVISVITAGVFLFETLAFSQGEVNFDRKTCFRGEDSCIYDSLGGKQ